MKGRPSEKDGRRGKQPRGGKNIDALGACLFSLQSVIGLGSLAVIALQIAKQCNI